MREHMLIEVNGWYSRGKFSVWNENKLYPRNILKTLI